jgi:hypothetical protein
MTLLRALAVLSFVAACGEVHEFRDAGDDDDDIDSGTDMMQSDAMPDAGPDVTPPDTQIDSGPTGLVAVASAQFTFSSLGTGGDATFECSLDSAAFTACASPTDLSALAEGVHNFRVRARDAAGNVDETPAERAWNVDTIAPGVTINAGVADGGATNDTTPTWTFTTAGSPSTIECRIDSAAYAPCTTTFTASTLSLTTHTFAIHVADDAGNQSTVMRSFTVDTTPPTATFTQMPADSNPLSQVTYAWSSSGGVTSTECRGPYQTNLVPLPAYAACSSPHSASVPSHTGTVIMQFDVRVRDAANNLTTISDTFSHYIIQ